MSRSQNWSRNLQAIGVDSTVRVLSQAEFLCKQRTDAKPSAIQACLVMAEVRRKKTKLNAIAVSWYGLNRLVQMSFVHDSFVVQGLLTGLLVADRHLPALYKRKIYRE